MADFTSNLIAHYKFQDNGNDETTNFNGSFTGSPSYAAGKVGKALSMVAGIIFDSNCNSIATDSSYTVACWVKIAATPLSDINIFYETLPPYWPLIYIENSTGLIQAVLDDNNGGITNSNNPSDSAIANGAWQHVAVRLDRSGSAKVTIFINGVAGTENNNGTPSGVQSSETPKIIHVSDDFLEDELRIYDRALTDADILALYNFENPVVNASKGGFFAMM